MRAHIVEDGRIVNTIEVVSLDTMENLIEAFEGTIGDYVTPEGKIVSEPPEGEA